MSAENNNFMSILKKNQLAIIVVLIVIGIIVVIVNMKSTNNNNTPKPTTKEEFSIENFPQSTPMNVMYSDASGNLSTTTDLGIQTLTVNGESTIKGNMNVNGAIQANNRLNFVGTNGLKNISLEHYI